MRTSTRVTRRRWIAACGGTLAIGTAGCLGGDDSPTSGSGGSGETSSHETGGNDGSDDGDDEPEIRGQLDVSETVTEDTEWRYDLEEGQTITAVFEGDPLSTGYIYRGESVDIMDTTSISAEGESIAQYTAEESGMYRVEVHVRNSLHVEIYVDST